MTKDGKQTRKEWLEQELRKWRHKHTQCNRRVKQAGIHLAKVNANIDLQLKAAETFLKEELGHLDYAAEYRKQLQEEYDDLLKKPVPKPKVKQPNGKIKCQYCGKDFSPQGIAAHEKACKRESEKAAEKAKLMLRLEELKKEELIPVEIPEVKKLTAEQMIITDPTIVNPEPTPMPTTEEKLELVKEVKQIVNKKKAELEAELEQTEGE